MLNHEQTTMKHWEKIDKLISSWLKERQDLILLYVSVDGLKDVTPNNTPISIKLQALSQLLIDYVSAGHFEIYDELIQEAEDFNEDHSKLFDSLLPRIQESTELALEFNDKYAKLELCVESMKKMGEDLSLLGEKMEERFSFEDQMIEAIHNRHKELVA